MSGLYKCGLADPPWGFLSYGKHRTTPHRCAEDHYETRSLDDLKQLPIGEMFDKNAALFMWVVDSHFPQAIELARAWGFEFKTCGFVWVKVSKAGHPRMSMGYWTRKQTEQCWMFTRGKVMRRGKGVRQVIQAQRREHSRKPDQIYERIEALVDGPRVEIFARQAWPGWDRWGDQADKFEAGAPAPRIVLPVEPLPLFRGMGSWMEKNTQDQDTVADAAI